MTDTGDAERVVAHLYLRSGRPRQSENDLANALSLDLKWFQPSAARAVVAALAREGYLQRDDEGELRPTFDVKGITVPLSYRPPADLAHKVAPRKAAPPVDGQPAPTPVPKAPTSPPGVAAPKAHAAPAASTPPTATFDLGSLLEALAAASDEDVADWVPRLDAVIQASDDQLTPEVALLLAGARQGIDVQPFLAGARGRLVVPRADQGA